MNSEAISHGSDDGAESTQSTPAPSLNLAAISEADRPTDVLFFDGVCGLCNWSVNFVLSRDHQRVIRFAPLQGTTIKQVTSLQSSLIPIVDGLDSIVWIDAKGKPFARSSAAVRVLWRIGGLWWLIGWLLWIVPRPLRDVGYRVVSTNRYRVFGKRETCRLPTAAERSRFLP